MPTYKSYIAGFALSVFFTILAFTFVMENLLTGNNLIIVLLGLAIVQAWVQLAFFLHLKPGARWNMAVFLSTVSLIFILVAGTLWIMRHLNYNMTAGQMNSYIIKNEGMNISSNKMDMQVNKFGISNLPADVLPEQIQATTSINSTLYALAFENNFNFNFDELVGKTIKWHGVLRSQDNGNSWTKIFTITDPDSPDTKGYKISYNPLGVFAKNEKLFLDIGNTNGAGSGEGELLRFSSSNDGKTWQRQLCYYVDMSTYYQRNSDDSLDLNVVKNPNGMKQASSCSY